jgi:hypothetical protein
MVLFTIMSTNQRMLAFQESISWKLTTEGSVNSIAYSFEDKSSGPEVAAR